MAGIKRARGQTSPEYVKPYWFVEVWQELRPFAVRLSADFAIFVAIWMILFVAHEVTIRLPLVTVLARFLVLVHEVAVVVTFMLLSLTALWDIIVLKRRGGRDGTRHPDHRS